MRTVRERPATSSEPLPPAGIDHSSVQMPRRRTLSTGTSLGRPKGTRLRIALNWLRERGFDVKVEERDLGSPLRESGYPSAPSVSCIYWADLIAIAKSTFVLSNYGSGMSRDEAVVRARQRYETEQGAE